MSEKRKGFTGNKVQKATIFCSVQGCTVYPQFTVHLYCGAAPASRSWSTVTLRERVSRALNTVIHADS